VPSLGGVVGGALAWAASGWSTPRATLAAAAALGALSLVLLRPLTAERGRES
jgi:hypothetical protein